MAASALYGMQRLILYIDGFNLYYRALRETRLLWLDLEKLAGFYFPRFDVVAIKYFTAHVDENPFDKEQTLRQQIYLRALRTTPKVEVILGNFPSKATFLPRMKQWDKGLFMTTEVRKTEEKKSDVNLATHMLLDGFKDRYDVAAVCSNDSDLELPVRAIREELNKGVVILNPAELAPASLKRYANSVKVIRASAIRAAQFPTTITDENGTFHRPPAWDPGLPKEKRQHAPTQITNEVEAFFGTTNADCDLHRSLKLQRRDLVFTMDAMLKKWKKGTTG